MATKPKRGSTFTKTIERGPNKGDRVVFRVAPGGNPYPIRVLRDVGTKSTLRDNSGVKFGKKTATKKKATTKKKPAAKRNTRHGSSHKPKANKRRRMTSHRR